MGKYQKGEFLVIPNKHVLAEAKAQIQAVYMWICNFTNEDGECFPSRQTIGRLAGVSESTVDRAIKWLCDKGALIRRKRKSEDGSTNLTSIYQLMIVEMGGVRVNPPPGVSLNPGGVRETPITQSTKLNPPNELKETGFDAFWTAYPRHVSKKNAKKAWDKISITPELLKTILDSVDAHRHSAQWVKDDGTYIPHPASWLNAERWNDEISVEAEKKAIEKKKKAYIDGDFAYQKNGKWYVVTWNGEHCEYGGSLDKLEWR